jgi:hypothetical protein
VIDIRELQPTSASPLLVVESFPVLPQDGRFSFSPISFHASFVSETKVVVLDVRNSKSLFVTKATQQLYTPPGHFSPDGHFFAYGTSRGEIAVWENTPTGYMPRSTLGPRLPFKGFSFSPTAISILSWGPGGVQLLHPTNHVSPPPPDETKSHRKGGDHSVVASTGGMLIATAQQEDSVVSRRTIVDPGQICLYFRFPQAHHSTVELLAPDIYLAGHQRGDRRGCLQGTRETVLREIELWVEDFTGPPIFWLNGLTGTGKSAIAQTIVDQCDAHGKLGLSVFCSRDVGDHDHLRLIFPTLAIQLAQKDPKARLSIVSLLRSNPDILYESPSDQVEKLIVNPLKSANIPAVIVIDGLDEWTDGISQSAILSAMEYWIKEIPKVKFFMTSRADFHLPLGGLVQVFTLHNAARDLIDNDIRLFLEHELSGLAIRKGLDKWPTDAQLDQLCDRGRRSLRIRCCNHQVLGLQAYINQ